MSGLCRCDEVADGIELDVESSLIAAALSLSKVSIALHAVAHLSDNYESSVVSQLATKKQRTGLHSSKRQKPEEGEYGQLSELTDSQQALSNLRIHDRQLPENNAVKTVSEEDGIPAEEARRSLSGGQLAFKVSRICGRCAR